MSRLRLPSNGFVLAVSVIALTLGMTFTPAIVSARVPRGFVGMDVDGPLLPSVDTHVSLARQLDQMVASGVESIRMTISWEGSEPYRSWAGVPRDQASHFENVGGVPMTFTATDQIVGLAAQRGLTVLPVVLYTPTWDDAPHPAGTLSPPRSDAPYGNFLGALVRRYGPHGTFWRSNPRIPRVPIRMWQIWNEPNLIRYWPIQPFAESYVALLRVAHEAIKSADPGAKVVLAGLTNYEWDYLDEIYKVQGSGKLFDVVASHPYTKEPDGVLTILRLVRNEMNRNGDGRKPIIVSEVSWPSSLHKTSQYFGFETTQAGQASRVAALLPKLGRSRRSLGLMSFYYYTWMTWEEGGPFGFAGLLGLRHGRIFTKPAYASFRSAALVLDGCRVKAEIAPRCLKRG